MSSSYNNFYAMAMIPCTTAVEAATAGHCQTNIDGECIYGGTKVAGASGYELASLGFPSAKCYSFPLFAGSNKPYTQFGWGVETNSRPLRMSRPIL